MIGARVLLKSPFNAVTGYGRDGIALALALERAGCYVMLSPISLAPPLPEVVAFMLTRPPVAPFDLLLNHTDPAQIGITSGERKSSLHTAAVTMWEFEEIGKQDWEPTLHPRLDRFDTVISYDPTTEHALAPYLRGQKCVQIQGGYGPDNWKMDPRAREWSGTFRFGMAGILNARKNPFAAVRAFERVHELYPDTELHLKTMDKSLHPAMEERYPGLHIHYAYWSDAEMLAFYRSIHAYVAPSWGEGKNLPAIEAASTGAVPIVSDCGGHRMWASPEFAYLTPGTMEEIPGGQGLVGLKVDEDALVEQMIHVIEHRDEARAKGEIAARTLPAMMNWDAVVRRWLQATLG